MQITVVSLGIVTVIAGQHLEAVCTPHWVVILLNVSDSCRQSQRSSACVQQELIQDHQLGLIQKQHVQAVS